jgi:hypothetical protein
MRPFEGGAGTAGRQPLLLLLLLLLLLPPAPFLVLR